MKFFYIFLIFFIFNCKANSNIYPKIIIDNAEQMLRSDSHLDNVNELKIPIFAEIKGSFTTFDLSGGRDDIQEGVPSNTMCFNGEKEELICIKNQVIQIRNKEQCITHIYDDVVLYLNTRYGQDIQKSTLIGYALSKEKAKPITIKRC